MGEHERVRAAYDRRARDGRYSPLRPDVVRAQAARAAAWATALSGSGHALGAFLDLGCGAGDVLSWAVHAGARPAVGVDLLEERLGGWPWTGPAGVCAVADGAALPFPSGAFDTVSCSTLFSSILDDGVARAVAAEVERVLTAGGVVLWHDLALANRANSDVRRFDREAVAGLFPERRAELRRAVLVPPVARRLAFRPVLAALVEQLPPARSHLSGALFPGS